MASSTAKQSAIYNYFHETKETFDCQVCVADKACGKKFKKPKSNTSIASNLKRHLQREHVEESREVERLDSSSKKLRVEVDGKESKKITEFFPLKILKATVSVTKDLLQSTILKMLCYDGVPTTFFKGEGFQTLYGEAAKTLGVALGRDAIRSLVITVAEQEKSKFRKCLQGKLIFLKFDGVTRLRSHFLGISIQYWEESVKNRTLALVNAKAKFNAEGTRDILMKAMADFDIKKEQILGCVVDNASTMTKTVRLMNEELESEEDEFDDDEEVMEEQDGFLQMAIPDATKIYHMRCAEHTLQLGIRDALKRPGIATFLTKIRSIAAFLRAPHADEKLKRMSEGKGMIIDMPTRWRSTFQMLSRLLELKQAVQEFVAREVYLSEFEWALLGRLVAILSIPDKTTMKLQKDTITPGECLYEWREAIFMLEKNGGGLAEDLACCLRNREKLLLETNIFLAGVWVDARYRVLLTPDQCESAKDTIRKVQHRLKEDKERAPEPEIEACGSPEDADAMASEFDRYLDGIERAQSTEPLPHQLGDAIKFVEQLGRLRHGSVWKVIEEYPECIRDVARTVSAIPCTQVSVERMFSHLKLVLRENRASMSDQLLDAILFLRTNKMV